jgi:hypothetical protein
MYCGEWTPGIALTKYLTEGWMGFLVFVVMLLLVWNIF